MSKSALRATEEDSASIWKKRTAYASGEGQSAAVVSVGDAASSVQPGRVEAAIVAGVKRELYYFLPSKEVDFTLPENFEGMSGGAVWRFYVSKGANDKLNVIDRRLIAVPFYQCPPFNGERELICRGPRGIYRSLTDAVTNEWPNEASSMQYTGDDSA